MTGKQTSDMIRATVQKPVERFQAITDAVKNSLKFDANPYLNAVGLKIEPEMMNVTARVLPSSKVTLKAKKLDTSQGKWDLRDEKLFRAPLINSVAFVFFTKVDGAQSKSIRDTILKKWAKMGVNISAPNAPIICSNPGVAGNVKGALMSGFTQAQTIFKKRCQLIVIILDPQYQGLYAECKSLLLCQANVQSQCMLAEHVCRGEIKDQYITNVGLKVNIKLGGATNAVDSGIIGKIPTLYMGADVTHASPGLEIPSVAAVVSSVDPDATRYSTYCRAQGPRMEMIEAMYEITTKSLLKYRDVNKKFPSRVIMYRDGVSAGQFKEVQEVEISAILKALKDLKCTAKLTFVVVQKRHSVRFFPIDSNADRSGNCLPGTVIDAEITHPTEFNFFLQSHAGIQGMSRPTLYHVLRDENKFNSDSMQQLTYEMCLLAQRATRTISMATPAYRAHLAAFYARMFIEKDQAGNMTLKKLADGIEHSQYYL
jgi:eukaryotic translation initiation factor 2C